MLANDLNFKRLVSTGSIVVVFSAPWCKGCGKMKEQLEELVKGTKVVVVEVPVEKCLQVPAWYGVRALPHLITFKGGKIVDQEVGTVSQKRLKELVKGVEDGV